MQFELFRFERLIAIQRNHNTDVDVLYPNWVVFKYYLFQVFWTTKTGSAYLISVKK